MPHTDEEYTSKSQPAPTPGVTDDAEEERQMEDHPRTWYYKGAIYHNHGGLEPIVKVTIGQLVDAELGFHGEAYQWAGTTVIVTPDNADYWSDGLVESEGLPAETGAMIEEWIRARFSEYKAAA